MRIVYSTKFFCYFISRKFLLLKRETKARTTQKFKRFVVKSNPISFKGAVVSGSSVRLRDLLNSALFFSFSVKSFARPKIGPSNIRCVLCCVVYGCGGLFVQLLMFPRFTRARAPSGQKTFTKNKTEMLCLILMLL